MASKVIEQMIMFDFEYVSPIGITIEETAQGVALIRGTLLREGTSANGNLYTIEEMEKITEQAEGMPIYIGTMTKVDPNLGIRRRNMHANVEKNCVGRIIRAIFDKTKRVIRFIAEIVNTDAHPHIIEEVKQGWGISIGGVAHKARLIIDQAGRILRKILGLKLTHVQLLPPQIKRGQEEAQVEEVEIQESMIFYEVLEPISQITEIDVGLGIKEIEIF